MDVKIFTFAFNRPDILKLQINSLRKNLKNDHEINVIHDSRNNQYVEEFSSISKLMKVNYYHNNSEPGKNPSVYHAESLKWTYEKIVREQCSDDIVIFLDHDMFLVQDLDIENEMLNYDVMGVLQFREDVKYLWPGLFIFKQNSISQIEFDFDPQEVRGKRVDTGGGTYKLLENSNVRFKDIDKLNANVNKQDPKNNDFYYYELFFDKKFFHFGNGSNWKNNFYINDSVKVIDDFDFDSNLNLENWIYKNLM